MKDAAAHLWWQHRSGVEDFEPETQSAQKRLHKYECINLTLFVADIFIKKWVLLSTQRHTTQVPVHCFASTVSWGPF